MNDDAKKTILARRASFVAAAMVGIACGKTTNEPPPMPCLSVAYVPTDAGGATPDAEPEAPAGGGASATDAGAGIATSDRDAGAATTTGDAGKKPGRDVMPTPLTTPGPTGGPMPCLSVSPRTKPPVKQ